jgi:hypothetical protein
VPEGDRRQGDLTLTALGEETTLSMRMGRPREPTRYFGELARGAILALPTQVAILARRNINIAAIMQKSYTNTNMARLAGLVMQMSLNGVQKVARATNGPLTAQEQA